MAELQLKDLFIGNTDAKNELLNSSKKEISAFREGFLMPDNVVLEHFFSGKRYYITGLKGTGKTALLRYISICVQDQLKASTAFVLFKSDIREEDRSNVVNMAEVIYRNNSDLNQYKDYERAWLLFLFQRIVKLSIENNILIFEEDSVWKQFKKYVQATLKTDNGNILFPRIKNGKVSLQTSLINSDFELEWPEQSDQVRDKRDVDFIQLVSKCESLFGSLSPNQRKLYLFVDELEVSFNTSKQYKRDIELIRDFVLAVNRINTISRQNGFGLYCITGIRKEVIAVTQSTGKEINKPISDFGINLRWQQSGGNCLNHPLIKIITRRLQYAERNLPKVDQSSSDRLFLKYFPPSINDKSIYEYILNKTWYRPRDIVRLLGIAQAQFPHENSFNQMIFEAINKDYSTECWTEQEEELLAKYPVDEIDGIKHLLMGIKCPFSIEEINLKANRGKDLYKGVEKLLSNHKLADILEDLFRIGIIGNTGRRSVRYSFRGDVGLLIEKNMTVHPALWNVLSITK